LERNDYSSHTLRLRGCGVYSPRANRFRPGKEAEHRAGLMLRPHRMSSWRVGSARTFARLSSFRAHRSWWCRMTREPASPRHAAMIPISTRRIRRWRCTTASAWCRRVRISHEIRPRSNRACSRPSAGLLRPSHLRARGHGHTIAGPFLQAAISQLKDTAAVKKNGLEIIDADFSYFANYRLPRSSPSAPDGSGRVRHTS